MKTNPILPTPSFSNFVHPLPLPSHFQPPHPLFFSLSCFFSWMGDHATFGVLFYLMIIWIYTCQTLVQEGSWCVFYATRHWGYWGLTRNVLFYRFFWFDITNQGPVVWHTHIIIYLHHLLCAHCSYLYCMKWLNKFPDIKNLLSTMSFLFKNYSLVSHISIDCILQH